MRVRLYFVLHTHAVDAGLRFAEALSSCFEVSSDASIWVAGCRSVVWGNTKAFGAGGLVVSGEVLPVPMTLSGSLFGMEQIQPVSAGWCHTAFVTGKTVCTPT